MLVLALVDICDQGKNNFKSVTPLGIINKNVGDGMEKLESLCITSGTFKWHRHCGIQWQLFRKLNRNTI